jgi:hypothetical protein
MAHPEGEFQSGNKLNKEAAKKYYDKLVQNTYAHLTFYTDGSGISNSVGAASYCPLTDDVRHQHLGPTTRFTVH